jgi:hypothetical protein
MKKLVAGLVAVVVLTWAASASAAGWDSSVVFTNQVASSPTKGGGYPVAAGATAPTPGTCRLGDYNSNYSESWLGVKPGTEDLIGVSKLFFEKYSTFYDFHLGAISIPSGTPSGTVQIPGYDCISTGTQDMPPSWTNNTDPNVDFDTKGRAYQITLPFNAYWVNLHPNGAIGAVYSDDLGKTWTVGNSGKFVEFLNNQSSFAFGAFEDKQWVAVNHFPLTRYVDHVYAMWAIFDGNAVKLRESVSRDRGQTFSKPVTITVPSKTGPSNFGVYPSVDAAGDLYVSFVSYPAASGSTDGTIYVTRSIDDGNTFTPWTAVARAHGYPGNFVNGNFRDGILQNFVASPTYAGHAYVTYEDYNAGTGTMDVKFSYTTDGGFSWSAPMLVNDAATANDGTDQFQPSVAAGPEGAVAVAFYDRRRACPADPSVVQTGKANACIDVSLQAYKDDGANVAAVGSNARITTYPWDPSEPVQKVDGIGQIACSGHRDPCPEVFIGDYFGLAVSARNIYALFVSTHYPSAVKADHGGPVYYQQQVLATVPRSGFGTGY